MRSGKQKSEFAVLVLILMTISSVMPAGADVVLDGSMGRSGVLAGPNYNITSDLGKQYGGNLFHSFSQFNLVKNDVATFSGPASVTNIISRVTGGAASSLDGALKSTINGANLYFINPAGIMFGPNASIDISGSFHATTADYLKLGTDGSFDARNQENSVLTSAPPSAFGFATETPVPISIDRSRLSVADGQTMSFIGGDITISNDADIPVLNAPGGRINLVSVASSGELILAPESIDASAFSKMGTISVSNSGVHDYLTSFGDITATTDSYAMGSGAIYIIGGKLVADNAYIFSYTPVSIKGKNIVVEARDSVELNNGSWICTDTYSTGKAGNITISAPTITVDGFSWISACSAGVGNGGSIILSSADAVTLSNSGAILTNVFDKGNAGNITIDTKDLTLKDGGYISSRALSSASGQGGDINISASDSVTILGPTIYSIAAIASNTAGMHKAGNITIATSNLTLRNGAIISAGTSGTGDGGDIRVENATDVKLSNMSSIRSEASSSKSGNAGDISITTKNLTLQDNGIISTVAASNSNSQGGNIDIIAENSVTVAGYKIIDGSDYESWIRSDSHGSKAAGTITITTPKLTLLDLGRISSDTYGSGNGGAIHIKNADEVTISTLGQLSTQSISSGNAGEITIDTRILTLSDAGKILSNSYGTGSSGDITITAYDTVNLSGHADDTDYSSLETVTTGGGKGGNIHLTTPDLIMDNTGRIRAFTTNSGDAGNVEINVNRLSMTNGATITASTSNKDKPDLATDKGGVITINATDSATISGSTTINGETSQSGIILSSNGKGNAGDLVLKTGTFTMSDGANILSTAHHTGNGGRIDIEAKDYSMSNAMILAGSYSFGDAGVISLSVDDASFVNNSRLDGRAYSTGNAGSIDIEANNSLTVNNSNIISGTEGSGTGGSVSLTTPFLTIADGGRISAESFSTGKSGNLILKVSDTIAMNNGFITTSSQSADGGDIFIDPVLMDLKNSRISTFVKGGAGNGGNIKLAARQLVLDNSSIIADANAGNGGNINLDTQALIQSAGSKISASSKLGVSGAIFISSPIVDVGAQLADLPETVVEVTRMAPKRCASSNEEISSFTVQESSGALINPDRPITTR